MLRRSSLAISVLLGVIVIIGALQTPLLKYVRDWVWSFGVGSVAKVVHINLQEPDQSRLEKLLAENIRLKSELKDYAHLKKNIGSPAFDDFKSIPAALIGRPLDTFQSEFIISQGAQNGVTLGAPLVIQGSILVGFVSELHEHSAVGRLLVHPSTTLAADVIDPTVSVDQISSSGLVQGKSYTSLFLTTVPRDKPLHEGSQVVTQAKPGELPGGLLIGTVKKINDQKSSAYKEAILDTPYDSDSLNAVSILVLP